MKRRPLSSAQQTDPSLDDTLNGAGEHYRTHDGDVVGQCSVGPKRRIESDRTGPARRRIGPKSVTRQAALCMASLLDLAGLFLSHLLFLP
jgi:hypothetical protein